MESVDLLKIKEGDIILNPGFEFNILRFPKFIIENEEEKRIMLVLLESLKIKPMEKIINPFDSYIHFDYPNYSEEENEREPIICDFSSIPQLIYPHDCNQIQPFIELINQDYQEKGMNIYNMLPENKNVFTHQYCIEENLCKPITPYFWIESPLKNTVNICYLNSLLHLLYPVFQNIIYVTNVDILLENLGRLAGYGAINPDHIRIIEYILTTMTIERNRRNQTNIDNRVYQVIRLFLKNKYKIGDMGIEFEENRNFGEGDPCDVFDAIASLFENLQNLLYCTRNCNGLIFYNYSAENPYYSNGFIDVMIESELSYNLQQKINDYIFETTLNPRVLVNVGLWLPLFIIVRISVNELLTYPYDLNNIKIYNQLYEITDIVCKRNAHFVSYNKRINKEVELKWCYFDDFYLEELPIDSNIITHMQEREETPRIILLRKIL